MVTEQTAQPEQGAYDEATLHAQYEDEYRQGLQPPDAEPSTPDEGQVTEPAAPEASQPEPEPAAPEAPETPPAEETPAQRERRLQAEVDRVIAAYRRGEPLTSTERAKVRELAQLLAQSEPDIVQPQIQQAQQQGAQQAQAWGQLNAIWNAATPLLQALERDEITAAEVTERLKPYGIQSVAHAGQVVYAIEQAYEQERQRQNQPDVEPVRQAAFAEGVNQLGTAFEKFMREVPEIAAIPEAEWSANLAKARAEHGIHGALQVYRDALFQHWEKQYRGVTTAAAQQAREQATTEALQRIPPPDITQGMGGGANYQTEAEWANAYLEDKISYKEYENRPTRPR